VSRGLEVIIESERDRESNDERHARQTTQTHTWDGRWHIRTPTCREKERESVRDRERGGEREEGGSACMHRKREREEREKERAITTSLTLWFQHSLYQPLYK